MISPHTYMALLEGRLISKRNRPANAPLFILGLPRSGTTLVYQYIVHRLKVSYFTNGVGKYPEAPCLVTSLQKNFYGEYVSDFRSRYGKVRGAVAPREAGAFWARFFSLEDYTDIEDLSVDKVRTLQKTIACIETIFDDAVFVNKNVKHLLRITALKEIFPNCLFLVVERDFTCAALSMLRARQELDVGQWLSVRPPDYARLRDLSLPEQIAGQYFSLAEKLEGDLADISSKRILRITYEDFCKNPDYLINKIQECMKSIQCRNNSVDCFPVSKSIPATLEEKELIRIIERGQR